jgi:hypothetical protein
VPEVPPVPMVVESVPVVPMVVESPAPVPIVFSESVIAVVSAVIESVLVVDSLLELHAPSAKVTAAHATANLKGIVFIIGNVFSYYGNP